MAKKEMIESILMHNKDRRNLKNIIKALGKVDRKFFVNAENPYVDAPISIGYNQTISQPRAVARMLSLLELTKGQSVLEIGSGSGWNAALLAYIANPGKVISVERIRELNELAQQNLKSAKLNLKNIEFIFADAMSKNGLWKIKFDRIIATAAADPDFKEDLIEMAKNLLNENGLILFPTTDGNLELWRFKEKGLKRIYLEYGYAFVPLVKGTQQF